MDKSRTFMRQKDVRMSVNKYIINIGSFLSLCGAFVAMHYTLFNADDGFNFLLSFIFAIISMSMIIYSNFKIQHRKIPALGCFMLSFIVCFAMVYGWGEFWTKYSLRNYGRMTRAIISDVYPVRNRYRTVCFF